MIWIKAWLWLNLALILTAAIGCTNAYRVGLNSDLRVGMTRQELVWTFGNPDADFVTDTFEKVNYFNRQLTGLKEGETGDYYIFLRDGRVIEYGIAQIHHQTY